MRLTNAGCYDEQTCLKVVGTTSLKDRWFGWSISKDTNGIGNFGQRYSSRNFKDKISKDKKRVIKMFTVKFLRHNPKNLSRTNRKQKYSFEKTFKNVTELIQYLDKAYPTVTVADCYEGMTSSDWYGYIQKKARMNQKSLEKAVVTYPDKEFLWDIYEDSLKGVNPENKYNRTTLNKMLHGNSKQKRPYKYYKKHNL